MQVATVDNFINTILSIYSYMIIAYIIMSWLPNARNGFIGQLLSKICEPYLSPFRRLIPPIGGMIDISPIVALIALRFVTEGIIAVVHFFI